MEPSFNLAGGITDEWGKCIVESEDMMLIERDGVLKNIQRQNPAIVAVEVLVNRETDELIDWATAGNSIGASTRISYLEVSIMETLDPLNVQAFFRGLALNRSIRALKIEVYIQEEEDDGECVKKAFKALLPFFRRNKKLQMFEVWYDGRLYPEGCVNDVLTAAKSLKSLHLSYGNWELTTKAILQNGHIHHLSLDHGELSRGACVNIRNLLSDQQCVLSSLTLDCLDCHPALYQSLINGVSNNRSLKCLKLRWMDEDFAICFIDSMRHLRFSALETVNISGSGDIFIPSFSLDAFVQQMPNVKSLSLYNCKLDRVVQETNNSVAPPIMSALRELSIKRLRRDDDLCQLSSYILRNTSLRVLVLDSGEISSASWVTFFDTVRRAKYLESIKITVVSDDAVIESFSYWIMITRTLKALEVSFFGNISSVGRRLFAAALASLENLEDIKLDRYALTDDETGMLLLNAFIAKPTLKRVSLTISTRAQLQVILNAIGSPTCGITDMKIGYYNQMREQAEHERISINSLQSNASLRFLELNLWMGPPDFHWFSHADIICNTSSIDATFRSNHTLESLSLNHGEEMPIDIYNMLYLNKNPNKHSVIREKILRNHNLHAVNFAPTSLPVVFSWLGHPDVDQKLGLSQLFRILRAVPHMIDKKVGELREMITYRN